MAKLESNIVVDIVSVISIFVFCVVPTVFSDSSIQRLYLPPPVIGPDSYAFDSNGEGPFTTVSDGRILKYERTTNNFSTYAYITKNRLVPLCDGTNNTNLVCGRGLGLGFHDKTGKLYVVSLFSGLVVVKAGGGLAELLVTSADGVPFLIPDALEVDQRTGFVYFTDLSSKYNISQIAEMIANGDASGRLMKYDPETKNVSVLLKGLAAPAGVAISKEGNYLVVTELLKNRVLKYWLTGSKANTAEVLLNLIGSPDNIKRNEAGDFWIAVTFPIQGSGVLLGQKMSGNGTLLETLTLSPEFTTIAMSEVNEHKGSLFLGSLFSNFVGVKKVS